jgi:enediyne biosynthesis protein E4
VICPEIVCPVSDRFRPRGAVAVFLRAICVAAVCLGAVDVARAAETPRPPRATIAAGARDVFEDVTLGAGIEFIHQFCHRRIANIVLSNGSGGAVLDYDSDGWMDLFFVNWGPLEGVTAPGYCAEREPNRLYRNRGDGTFEDVTLKSGLSGAGFSSAVTVGDYDNDGHPDIYIVNIGKNQLFRNRGDGSFEEVTDAAGVGDAQTGISAAWLDADGDGHLDLFVANYLTFDPSTVSEQNPGAYPGPLAYPGEANVLYRNRGDGTFEDVTRKSGLYAPGHRAMSVTAFDCDWDGDTDLYISNDDTPNALWLNDGKGIFREIGLEAGVAFNSIGEAPGSMNAAMGDIDDDGLMDIFVTRLGYGSLYLRRPQGHYDDRMWASGLGRLTQRYVGWGGVLLDFNNNGLRDIFVANGDAFTLDGTLPLLLQNLGNAQFTNAVANAGRVFRENINGRGSAVLDYNNDGRTDLLVTVLADRPLLLRNRDSSAHHWLTLELEGTRGNRDGYGALITLKAGDRTWKAEAMCNTGFLMQSDPRVHFGLGDAQRADSLEIRWPGGKIQRLENQGVDRILRIREPQD